MFYDPTFHERDAFSYFLQEPVVSVQTIAARSTENAPEGLSDPMLLLFRTASGTLVTDELYVNTKSGYEVRTELVGSLGRSEEHTSELQSRGHVVCRLLLAQKKA